MRDVPISPTSPQAHRGQTAEALAHIEKVVIDGLNHGFFDYTITCQIVKGGTRQLVVRAGKSHQFNIRQEELPR